MARVVFQTHWFHRRWCSRYYQCHCRRHNDMKDAHMWKLPWPFGLEEVCSLMSSGTFKTALFDSHGSDSGFTAPLRRGRSASNLRSSSSGLGSLMQLRLTRSDSCHLKSQFTSNTECSYFGCTQHERIGFLSSQRSSSSDLHSSARIVVPGYNP